MYFITPEKLVSCSKTAIMIPIDKPTNLMSILSLFSEKRYLGKYFANFLIPSAALIPPKAAELLICNSVVSIVECVINRLVGTGNEAFFNGISCTTADIAARVATCYTAGKIASLATNYGTNSAAEVTTKSITYRGPDRCAPSSVLRSISTGTT